MYADSHVFYMLDGVVLSSLSVFGIVGTLMSLWVLVKSPVKRILRRLRRRRGGGGGAGGASSDSRRRIDHFSQCLTALAVYDTNFLVMALICIGIPHLEWE